MNDLYEKALLSKKNGSLVHQTAEIWDFEAQIAPY